MEPVLLISILISLILTAFALPKWIRKTKITGFLWEDMNKYKHENKPSVSASGGLIVVMAFTLSVLFYIALKTFFFKADETTLSIFALLGMILILAIVGFSDDVLGWRHGGLSIRFRIFLALLASIPLVVINAGTRIVNVPFIGSVNLGLLYPLIIIPIGIAGATTTFNFLAGYNGLEASQGILMLGGLSIVAYFTGSSWLSLIGLCMIASLLIFYFYNRFPAKVFPGNILTYPVGALIAGMAILGNFEKIAVFFFLPYIVEVILKSRGKLKKESFAKPNKDNILEMPYKKNYSLNHIAIIILKKLKPSHKVYEKDVVYFINLLQILIIIIGFVIFRKSIFV